jgi:ketosteroid isomerase-like protein
MAEGGVKEAVTRVKRRVGIENPSAAEDDGNVGRVRGALRAFGEGDFEQFLDCLKPDVTWEAPSGNFPGEDALDGRDEIKEKFIADAGRTFTKFGFRPEKFLDAEDENAVVVFGTFAGEGRTGDAVEEPAVQVWQFEGSEAEHVRIYVDSAAFPEVVTEEMEKEWEEEKEEEEKEDDSEAKGEDDSEAEGDDDSDSDDDSEGKSEESSESKSEESSESRSDDDSDSSSDDDSESKSDDDSESKSDDDSESKSDDDSDSDSDSEKSGKSD